MVKVTKEIGLNIIMKDKELKNIQMEIYMKVHGKMVKEKALEFKNLIMVKFMKVTGIMIK